jgi:hypothetical protein
VNWLFYRNTNFEHFWWVPPVRPLEEGTINVDEIEEEDDIHGLENSVNNTVNWTFINHSQDNNSEKMFKSENCEFRALNKSDVKNHKKTIHNWCPTCFTSFVTQERLIKHTTKKHNNKL